MSIPCRNGGSEEVTCSRTQFRDCKVRIFITRWYLNLVDTLFSFFPQCFWGHYTANHLLIYPGSHLFIAFQQKNFINLSREQILHCVSRDILEPWLDIFLPPQSLHFLNLPLCWADEVWIYGKYATFGFHLWGLCEWITSSHGFCSAWCLRWACSGCRCRWWQAAFWIATALLGRHPAFLSPGGQGRQVCLQADNGLHVCTSGLWLAFCC